MRIRYALWAAAGIGLLARLLVALCVTCASGWDLVGMAILMVLCGLAMVSIIYSVRRRPIHHAVDGLVLTERGWARRRYALGTALGATIEIIRSRRMLLDRDSPGTRPTRLQVESPYGRDIPGR